MRSKADMGSVSFVVAELKMLPFGRPVPTNCNAKDARKQATADRLCQTYVSNSRCLGPPAL